MKSYINALKQCADFSGRTDRGEFCRFHLLNLLLAVGMAALDVIAGTMNFQYGIGVISGIYGLFMLAPMLAICVRRLHDTGRSGRWLLFALLPVIGTAVVIIYFCLDSESGRNKFGETPKALPAF